MNKVYTKTGDEGMTSLRGGVRVPKDDIRIEANGTIDLLNALIGKLRVMPEIADEWEPFLLDIQKELMGIMSHIATPPGKNNPRQLHVEELIERMERKMDEVTAKIEERTHFILPSGSLVSAEIHIARTVARQAERRLWTVNREFPVNPAIMRFMNRLSDFLFIMTKEQLQCEGIKEESWNG
ncbi:MAG: cob(I)yrinic acid a,c-diamide adenosyltransferase [Bacteroidaceae bacterium]|nr:cob(I)yrinic acid a,c-diamide adenosyltransferase [Bacteroidaceae bacterium]